MPERKMYEFAHIHNPSLYKSETMADGVQAHLDDLQKLSDKFAARIAQIRTDRNLTVAGQQDALAKLRADIEKELSDWGAFQKHYVSQIERLESEAQPKRHPKDDAAYELRQREIRDVLRTLDPVDLEARILEAAENGEDELLHAFIHSPVRFRLATADLIAKIQRQQWERQFPNDAASLHDLKQAQQEVQSALGSVRAGLRKQGLETRPDALTGAEAA
jgi:hypothetical protein